MSPGAQRHHPAQRGLGVGRRCELALHLGEEARPASMSGGWPLKRADERADLRGSSIGAAPTG